MAKTIRSKTGWPGKKRTYHCGRKRCRYLKDMQEERRLEREAKSDKDTHSSGGRRQSDNTGNKKKVVYGNHRRFIRDRRGRRVRVA